MSLEFGDPPARLQILGRRRVVYGVACVVGVTALASVSRFSASTTPVSMSLIDGYPETIKRSPHALVEAFSVYDATIEGETKRVVYARPPSRIIWKVTPPARATLSAWLALRDDAWNEFGDGVVFRIGVSNGKTYSELLTRYVNPYARSGDRRWIKVSADLDSYAGQAVDIILNTDLGLPNTAANGRADLALWGEPIIVERR